MNPNRIRVLHPVLREGVAVLVSQQPDLLMVGEASTRREALAKTSRTQFAQCTVVPGRLNRQSHRSSTAT
jgi:DNA-binding NarL/FixJ family response regulator